jgi:hypothetical protein
VTNKTEEVYPDFPWFNSLVDMMRKRNIIEFESAVITNGTMLPVRLKLGETPVEELMTLNADSDAGPPPSVDPPKIHDDGLTSEQQEEHYGSSR